MQIQRRFGLLVVLSLIAMLALVSACKNKSTNPGPGVAAKELDSGNIANGGQYAHLFASAGTFNYHCTIHGAGMAGQVIVGGGSPTSADVSIGPGNTYSPTPAIVAPGGTVTWTNNGSTHTVTSN